MRDIARTLACTIVLLLVAAAVAGPSARAQDDFPIVGTWMRDMVCKGDGSERSDLLVTITPQRIESPMGSCAIRSRKRDGNVIAVHVECKLPGDQRILGDVTFTIKDDKTVQFEDQDHTSDATLYKCGG